ncbi:hypothetical protein BJV82DRAFT_667644 [Fennellomyces sp. T-0311]|nr:hypothetical protein BJV82DRAFT_667644 [Fennellomyces sp. T-0311]
MNPSSVRSIPRNKGTVSHLHTKHLLRLPAEVLFKIFELLTFRQRVRLTRVNRLLREIMFFWPGFARTLSNEDNRHRLSQVLAPYLSRIDGSNVRNLTLMTPYVTMEARAASTQELSQFIDMLWAYRSNIQMYCISRPQWLTKFIGLTSQSLTQLTLLTSIGAHEIMSATQFLLSKLPRLLYLSFGSHLSVASRTIATTRPSNTPFDPYNQIHDAAPWSVVPHTSLRELHISSDSGIGDYNSTFFTCDVQDKCPNIEKIVYCCSPTAVHYNPDTETSGEITRSLFTLDNHRTIQVIGRDFSVYTKQHTEAILAIYHHEMTRLIIEPPDTEAVGYFSGFSFPRLEKVTIAFKKWPQSPNQKDPWFRLRQDIGWFLWLSYIRCLRHIVLENMDIMSRDIRRLKDRDLLPNMETLKLVNCRYRLDLTTGNDIVSEHHYEVTIFNPNQ